MDPATGRRASYLASPRDTLDVLERHGLRTKHRLGQNFLVNDHVIQHILELAEVDEDDVVLEVGPGIGTLTVALLERVRAVCAIEADRSLPEVLQETCERDGEKLALIQGDALKVTPASVREALLTVVGEGVDPEPGYLISNLPYQVAATVILDSFMDYPTIHRSVTMVQREVADRIMADPGRKDYGAYTVKLRLLTEPTGRFEVGPANFMPPPRVDSAVVRLDRMERCAPGPELDAAIQVIDGAFCQRRKTIRNAMASAGFPKELLDEAFARADIDPRRRAETIEVDGFIALTRTLLDLGWTPGKGRRRG